MPGLKGVPPRRFAAHPAYPPNRYARFASVPVRRVIFYIAVRDRLPGQGGGLFCVLLGRVQAVTIAVVGVLHYFVSVLDINPQTVNQIPFRRRLTKGGMGNRYPGKLVKFL